MLKIPLKERKYLSSSQGGCHHFLLISIVNVIQPETPGITFVAMPLVLLDLESTAISNSSMYQKPDSGNSRITLLHLDFQRDEAVHKWMSLAKWGPTGFSGRRGQPFYWPPSWPALEIEPWRGRAKSMCSLRVSTVSMKPICHYRCKSPELPAIASALRQNLTIPPLSWLWLLTAISSASLTYNQCLQPYCLLQQLLVVSSGKTVSVKQSIIYLGSNHCREKEGKMITQIVRTSSFPLLLTASWICKDATFPSLYLQYFSMSACLFRVTRLFSLRNSCCNSEIRMLKAPSKDTALALLIVI